MFGLRRLRGDWQQRLATVEHLTEKGGLFAVRTIRRALHDANPDVRIAAIRGLMKHRAASATDLFPLLQDLYLARDLPLTVIPFPVRAEAWRALQTLGWTPSSEEDLRLIETAEGRSIANHRYVTYFLGAGFARAYDMPLASELLGLFVKDAWPYARGIRDFATHHLGYTTPEEVVAMTIERVLDALYTAIDAQIEPAASMATGVLLDLQTWIKGRLDTNNMFWKPANAMLDRFFRFLASNNQFNFIITTNWDAFIDVAALTYAFERDDRSWPPFIDYGLYLQDRIRCMQEDGYTPFHLYKMNGSVDWLWCARCHVIYGRYIERMEHNYISISPDAAAILRSDSQNIFRCDTCWGAVSPMLVMPSPRRPQHLLSRTHSRAPLDGMLGFAAEPGVGMTSVLQWMSQAMSPASLLVFIGYSLPEYDTDTLALIDFALQLAGSLLEIHVVGWEPDFRSQEESPTCRRYAEVLQRPFQFFPNGVEEWVRTHVPDSHHIPAA